MQETYIGPFKVGVGTMKEAETIVDANGKELVGTCSCCSGLGDVVDLLTLLNKPYEQKNNT